MAKKFTEYQELGLTRINREILAKWEEPGIFHKSIDEYWGRERFILFEGPPSADGHPGTHHVLARAIEDTFDWYGTMQKFQMLRKVGWDAHGLPIELSVKKELGANKKDIDNKGSEHYISVKDYDHRCHENVMKFTEEWRTLAEEMGYLVDFDRLYITYDSKYTETLWWLLK